MTNQTKRIPASKVIIEPFVERRIRKAHKWKTKLSGMIINLTGNRRNPKHNYLNPPQLFSVFIPVEPQPSFEDGVIKIVRSDSYTHSNEKSIDLWHAFDFGSYWVSEYRSHSPNDQIVFEDEWADRDLIVSSSRDSDTKFYLKSKCQFDFDDWQSPLTMPAHLNTFTVLKVLGCEEKEIIKDIFIPCEGVGDNNGFYDLSREKEWHFNYLMRKEVKE